MTEEQNIAGELMSDFTPLSRLSDVFGVPLTGGTGDGWVYFVGLVGTGRVKIGWSRNPAQRMRAMLTDVPFEKQVLCAFQGSVADERALHKRFVDLCVYREWFSIAEGNALDRAIRAAIARNTVGDSLHAGDLTDAAAGECLERE